MRILFFSHYFPPEVNAPASRTYEHALRWVRAGHDVTVVTCAPNCPDGVVYDGYRNCLLPQDEVIDGIRVRRVWTYVAANQGTTRRIANYVSYMASAALNAIALQRPDVIVATTPQFFCAWAGRIVAKLRRIPFILEVRDIWPESIAAVGALKGQYLLRFLAHLERRLYNSADHIVAVGEGYRDNILSKANVADRISVITNGVDLQQFSPGADGQSWRRECNLTGKFVCSYVGTIGMAHGLDVVLRTAKRLQAANRRDVAFCLVGDGAARKELEEMTAREELTDLIRFTGRQPKEKMPAIYAASDACLVHLRKCELFETVIPSKMFEVMALERPIIMGVNGPARQMVADAGCGIDMVPESDEQLLNAVCRLADDPAGSRAIGARGRAYVAEHFNRDVLAERYAVLLGRFAKNKVLGSTSSVRLDAAASLPADHAVNKSSPTPPHDTLAKSKAASMQEAS